MTILMLFEITFALGIFALIATQVLIPLVTGTPLFPGFSSWRVKHEETLTSLRDKRDQVEAEFEEFELRQEIKQAKKKES